jgi:PLD-like domain
MLNVIASAKGVQGQHRSKLRDLLKDTDGLVRIASPYVTDTDLLSGLGSRSAHLLTSLSSMDIITGASSLKSLRSLVEGGVHCRCVVVGPRLHAKVYIFGAQVAVVTSANLTRNALDSNIEAGVHLAGITVLELVTWFDTLWKRAVLLSLNEISQWEQAVAHMRSEYSELRRKVAKIRMPPSEARPALRAPERLQALFGKAGRFFVCNTNRKHDPDAEHLMREERYAAAWEEFAFGRRMREVEPGSAILMYANGDGIVGIGRARASCEILEPGNHDRLRNGRTREWRIPVDWLVWDETNPFRDWPSAPPTFFDVSGDKYRLLRKRVRHHFEIHRPEDGGVHARV